MRMVKKVNKETQEPYEKFIWNEDKTKDYTAFREAEELLLKLADTAQRLFPEEFQMWLTVGQGKADFADFLILRLSGTNTVSNTTEGVVVDRVNEKIKNGDWPEENDEEYTQEDADEEFQMMEDRDKG